MKNLRMRDYSPPSTLQNWSNMCSTFVCCLYPETAAAAVIQPVCNACLDGAIHRATTRVLVVWQRVLASKQNCHRRPRARASGVRGSHVCLRRHTHGLWSSPSIILHGPNYHIYPSPYYAAREWQYKQWHGRMFHQNGFNSHQDRNVVFCSRPAWIYTISSSAFWSRHKEIANSRALPVLTHSAASSNGYRKYFCCVLITFITSRVYWWWLKTLNLNWLEIKWKYSVLFAIDKLANLIESNCEVRQCAAGRNSKEYHILTD